MRNLPLAMAFAVATIMLAGAPAKADGPTCKAQAAEKKLAGAALNSFSKKCEADATKACDAQAAEKHLGGAAKTSFTKKCLADAIGG